MKRLLYYLNQITDANTTTFRYLSREYFDAKQGHIVREIKDIYDGECEVSKGERMGVRREPIFWYGDVTFRIEHTTRMKPDRPTFIIGIPIQILGINDLTPAAADFCLRTIKPYFDTINEKYANKARPDRDNGKFYVYEPSGEVLIRNTAYFAKRRAKNYENGRGMVIYERAAWLDPLPDQMCLCIRIEVQLPIGKLKRTIAMLTKDMPGAMEKFIRDFDSEGLRSVLALEAKQNEIRTFLREGNYCAFIANGSILPREKNTALPMMNALPFRSVPEDEIEISGVRGMGIKRGVVVITGGGYSGKSTVLNAISAGIYNHAMGDGRELCITDDSAVTITAEDGRAVSCLNISPFIKWIPGGDTHEFSTSHASGSTSQAANIMEAIDCGAKLLLIDEDRSATNFMIRDALMRELIEKEPITPFTDRVRELSVNGVSTVLVIGGSGEYLAVADKIYMMDEFIIHNMTANAKRLAPPVSHPPSVADWKTIRVLRSDGFTSYPKGSGTEKLEVSDTDFIIIGDERIDIRALHDIATAAQTDTLAFMLRYLERGTSGDKNELEMLALAMRGLERKSDGHEIDLAKRVNELYSQIKREGLDIVGSGFFVNMNRFLELPREFELRAAINRMRNVTWTAT